MIFEYGEKELTFLKQHDENLAAAIDRIGIVQREVNPDPFSTLVSSIIGQQISGKAAETVWNRLCQKVHHITPEGIHALELEEIQSCGMSMRKAGYIKAMSDAGVTGTIDFGALPAMPDAQIVELLTKLPGIGIWTVEMLLIFSLCRNDIVSYHDFGIRKGMMKLYGLETLSKDMFRQYRQRYSPYGTVASFYLWEVAAGK